MDWSTYKGFIRYSNPYFMECQFCGRPVNFAKNEKEGEHDSCHRVFLSRDADPAVCVTCGKPLLDGTTSINHSICKDQEWMLNMPETE